MEFEVGDCVLISKRGYVRDGEIGEIVSLMTPFVISPRERVYKVKTARPVSLADYTAVLYGRDLTLIKRKEDLKMTVAKSTRIAVVQFPHGSKRYDFHNHIEDLNIGDTVVCHTVNGLAIGKVETFKERSISATRWVVDKIDLKGHEKRVANQNKIDAIDKEMSKRKQKLEAQGIDLYELYADVDPEMAVLLNQRKALTEPPNKKGRRP